jgi:hypothetical protein
MLNGIDAEEKDHGQIQAISLQFTGETEENCEKLQSVQSISGRDSKPTPL